MSIKPEFAKAIFLGSKRFEYRKIIFARPVDVIVVYASAPVQRVIGEFEIEQIWHKPVEQLWEQTNLHGGIDKHRFCQYFSKVDKGYAIEVGAIRAYEEPLCLSKNFGVKPPQSFIYLDFPWPIQARE